MTSSSILEAWWWNNLQHYCTLSCVLPSCQQSHPMHCEREVTSLSMPAGPLISGDMHLTTDRPVQRGMDIAFYMAVESRNRPLQEKVAFGNVPLRYCTFHKLTEGGRIYQLKGSS